MPRTRSGSDIGDLEGLNFTKVIDLPFRATTKKSKAWTIKQGFRAAYPFRRLIQISTRIIGATLYSTFISPAITSISTYMCSYFKTVDGHIRSRRAIFNIMNRVIKFLYVYVVGGAAVPHATVPRVEDQQPGRQAS